MKHASIEEIHDHAYGFRSSDHVASCPECGGTADAVTAERDALSEILGEGFDERPIVLPPPITSAPPRAVRFGWPAGAVAALLLASLAWLLSQPYRDRSSDARTVLRSQEEEIHRLITELDGPSPLRKELARLALLRYGGTALPALEGGREHPDLVDQIRGITPADRALEVRLSSMRISLEVDRVLYPDVLELLKPHVGAIKVDLLEQPETAFVTLRLKNATLREVMESLAGQMKVPFEVQSGSLVLGRRSEPLALAPVRIPVQGANVGPLIERLSDESPARREEAGKLLSRYGFGAEPELWKALESKASETRERAAALLRDLYRSPSAPPTAAPHGPLALPRINVDCVDCPLSKIASDIVAQAGDACSIVMSEFLELGDERTTFKVSDIPMDSALRLLVVSRGLSFLASEDALLIEVPGSDTLKKSFTASWTPPPHTLWLAASDAQGAEALVADLRSSDVARQKRAADRFREMPSSRALPVLGCAAGYLEGDALRRCAHLRQDIAARAGVWICDLPSGADLQTLKPAQRAILDSPVVLPGSTGGRPLENILKGLGIRFTSHAAVDRSLRVAGKPLALRGFLNLVLRSRGLDYFLDGETVVIDTAASVRAAVER